MWRGDMTKCILIVAALPLPSDAAAVVYSGGAGTEPNPYRIVNAADWNTLALRTEDGDSHFLMTADIDFSDASVTPAATEALPFTGVFNGGGHVLRNGRIH